MSYFLKRYAFLVCAGVYTGALLLLHALGRFPAPGPHDVSQLAGTPVLTLEGRVLHFPMTRWGQTRFLLEGRTWPQGAYQGRVVVTLHFPLPDLAPDEPLRVRGWLTRPRDPDSAHPFDERAYWAGYRAYALLHVWSDEALERMSSLQRPTWAQRAWRFHECFKQFWLERLPPEEAALLSSITLGSRGVLPTRIKQQCIRAGVYHILVVSGQKMALLIALAIGLLRVLHVPRRWAFWICCPVIVFYAAAVGADPPVVRASAMAIVALLATAWGRDVPGYYPFALAWMWILWREPEALFGASFQLSFGATAGLLAILPLLRMTRRRPPVLRWLMDSGIVSLAVHVGVWPLLLYYFHQLSLVGFLANWTLFPFSGFLTVLGLFIGAWGVWLPASVPDVLIRLMDVLLQGTLSAIERLSGWTWAAVAMPAPPGWVCGMYYGLLICILWKLHRHEEKSADL